MHQSKEGYDWHFGMKAHVGVDVASGLVHTVIGTAGNIADVCQAHALLQGAETAVLADAGYQCVENRAVVYPLRACQSGAGLTTLDDADDATYLLINDNSPHGPCAVAAGPTPAIVIAQRKYLNAPTCSEMEFCQRCRNEV